MNSSSYNLTDQQLIDQTLAGNTDAFGVLVSRHQDRLFNSLVHLMRNESDAEDVVQDAFVLALTKLGSFKGNSQFYTWLFRIARNSAISRLRKKRPKLSLDSPMDGVQSADVLPLELPGKVAAPSDEMERQERAQGLIDAMGRLSPEHREILVLREMDDLDYETIGEMLGLAVGTVRSRLHRARSQLREFLKNDGNGLP
jgi:RNA polymerase sigma-70 factor (ECF subfamily)